ncbi:hypothetical protein [Corynebacterium sp. ED61]|uniref:hypothetical protein n=1 Tax=Corynebacterium sp. ED61 TaxID=2211360 RepID=UPI00188485B0|nr:hypothetical protein [Corynebacterium sp. ED61]MBF0580852.1 hypothetical protein [Corynebacterium sp. ED61]
MNTRKVALMSITVSTMLLGACTATQSETPTDFQSEAQRDEALGKYACKKMQVDDPGFVYSAAGGRAAKTASDSLERAEIIRSQLMAINMDLTPTCTEGEPGYFPWLEDGYKEQLGIKFDYQTAKDAGVV